MQQIYFADLFLKIAEESVLSSQNQLETVQVVLVSFI